MRLRDLSIIQYQNVSTNPHIHRLWLSTASFRKQLNHLSENGFQILSMDDAVLYMEGENHGPAERPLSLTFDNGFLDFYEEVLPRLSKYHFPATLLISPQKVGKQIEIGSYRVQYLTWEHLRELADFRITIGAYEDIALNINEIPEGEIRGHIQDYKKMLEDKLGIEVRYFGVKEGVPNHGIRQLLISTEYRAFLTECPTNKKPDLYSIGRIQVDDDDFNIFLTKISKTYLFFKDKKSWKYFRRYKLDRVAHRLSEAYDGIRGMNNEHKA